MSNHNKCKNSYILIRQTSWTEWA